VVEVAPAYDHAEMTTVAAARVCYELLALMLLGPLTPRSVRICLSAQADPGNAACVPGVLSAWTDQGRWGMSRNEMVWVSRRPVTVTL
jgi:hypothetical protein